MGTGLSISVGGRSGGHHWRCSTRQGRPILVAEVTYLRRVACRLAQTWAGVVGAVVSRDRRCVEEGVRRDGGSTATPPLPSPLLAKAGGLRPQYRIAADRGRWICIREACRADMWRAAAEGRLLAMLTGSFHKETQQAATSCGRGACFLRSESSVRDLHSRERGAEQIPSTQPICVAGNNSYLVCLFYLRPGLWPRCVNVIKLTRLNPRSRASAGSGSRPRGAQEGGLPRPEGPVPPLPARAVKMLQNATVCSFNFSPSRKQGSARLTAGLSSRVRCGVVRCSWPWLVADREGVSIVRVRAER